MHNAKCELFLALQFSLKNQRFVNIRDLLITKEYTKRVTSINLNVIQQIKTTCYKITNIQEMLYQYIFWSQQQSKSYFNTLVQYVCNSIPSFQRKLFAPNKNICLRSTQYHIAQTILIDVLSTIMYQNNLSEATGLTLIHDGRPVVFLIASVKLLQVSAYKLSNNQHVTFLGAGNEYKAGARQKLLINFLSEGCFEL
eukprot:TRINITY_DN10463_c0_g2_i3.p1 TRINITY_DN10463_c0_g2~~TRINITY_DN10463_c0_g2_i3.p1  ORF type:complete len:197 (+),score=-3.32 TRINITY_DN10463_c0_g2_i3:983-1573(+)